VSNDVGGNIVITESSDVISTGEFIERSVFIDEFSDAVIFSLNWPGSDLDLTLRKPNGTVIDPSLAAVNFNIEYVERSNYEFYRVRSPMDGEWDLIVEAVNVACSEPFTVQITSEGKEVIFTASAQEPQITYPDSIAIRASVIAGDRVANAEVTGIVNRPDGSSVDLTLHDDGLEIHGDTHADDGTYSNFFSGYTINGIYTFDLVVNNQEGVEAVWPFAEPPPEGWTPGSIAPFRREASVLVIVSGVPEVPEEVSFNVWIVIGPAIGALLLSLVIYYMARRRTGVQRAT
jgi:hypothetical protein